MTERTIFTSEQSRRVGEQIGIDWASAPFDLEQFRMGRGEGSGSALP